MKVTNLHELFLETLRDINYAEKKLVKVLPGLAKKAKSPELRAAIESHLSETEGHAQRLDRVFSAIGEKPSATKCEALEGLLAEADEILGEVTNGSICDAAIISSAQTVEHYEIARYGTLCQWARDLGFDDAAAILAETLEEEKAADAKLSSIADEGVNKLAA